MKVYMFRKTVRYVPITSIYKYLNESNAYKFSFVVEGNISDDAEFPVGSDKLVSIIKAYKSGFVPIYDRYIDDVVVADRSVIANMFKSYMDRVDRRTAVYGPVLSKLNRNSIVVKLRETKKGRSVELMPPNIKKGSKITFLINHPEDYVVGDSLVFYPMYVGHIVSKRDGKKLKMFIGLNKKSYFDILSSY